MNTDTNIPTSYHPGFKLALPHGIAAAVSLPGKPGEISKKVWRALHPEERTYAGTLKGFKQMYWVGGRLALGVACKHLGVEHSPMLSLPSGEVDPPPGMVASVSHKRTLAVGMIGFSSGGTLGVDLEDLYPPRLGIASKVLTESEMISVQRLAPDRRWLAILLRFSIKESIYKALYPHVNRYVAFTEAEISLSPNGDAEVRLDLVNQEGPFKVDARYHWIGDRVLTTARIIAQEG